MKSILLLFFAVASFLCHAQTSYVAPTRVLIQKGYQFGVAAEMFNSSKMIDQDGNKVDYTDGTKFSRIQSELSAYYGLTHQFQVGGGVNFRRNASTSLNASTEKETDTSTGVQSTFLTFKYAFRPIGRLHYALEGVFRYMPYTNQTATLPTEGKMILGDDGTEYAGGLGVTYASRTRNFLTARAGLRQPGKDLSSEVYWQVEGAMAWKYLALIAGVDGVTSMRNSSYKDNPADKPVYNTGLTQLYNSVNREWIAPYAGVNVALSTNWRVEFRGSQVMSGRSTDLGTTLGISLIKRVDDVKKAKRVDAKFKEYDFEATITKVSPKKGFVIIDKGLADDVRKGMKIDFFEFDYVGGNILLARGTVIQSKAETAIVKITQTFNAKKALKPGIVARGSYQ